jgi:hypothetical protein
MNMKFTQISCDLVNRIEIPSLVDQSIEVDE